MKRIRYYTGGFIPIAVVSIAVLSTFLTRGAQVADSDGPIRLADALRIEDVAASPLKNSASAASDEKIFPVNSVPDDSIAGNPLALNRRLDLGSVELSILFAPPDSKYRWDVALPQDAVLDVGLGIVRDLHSQALSANRPRESGIQFIVRLDIDGYSKIVFQKRLDLPPRRESRTVNYQRERIVLPGGGRRARLTLQTLGDQSAFAFWHAPILFQPRAEKSRLNVVLVSIDTLRADHVGAYGYGRETSPNLDSLAKESAVFLNTFASAPWTLPSHVSMLTGLNCLNHRVYYEYDKIDPKTPTLATILHRSGYACGAVTGAGFVSALFGFSRGFDSYGLGQGDMSTCQTLAAEAAHQAEEWLSANAEKPFFLFLHTYQVHHPYKPPTPYDGMFVGPNPKWRRWDFVADHGGRHNIFKPIPPAERDNIIGLYDGGIRYTDEVLIRPLVAKLKALGLWERTLLIITSDHGEEFFDHGGWAHTRALYDESLKVPLIVHFPGGRNAGRRTPIVRLIDVVPTVLDALDIPFETGAFEGRSLFPILRGRETADRTFTAEIAENVVEYHVPSHVATNSGRTKLILNGEFKKEFMDFFVVKPKPSPLLELYDIGVDPSEKANLIDRSDRAAIARSLVERASAVAAAMDLRNADKGRLSKTLEDQLRALGYIR